MSIDTTEAYTKALELAEAGQHRDSLEYFQDYLKDHPDNAQALSDTGTVKYCLGKTEQAIEYFEKSIEADQQYSQAYWNLFEAYISNNDPDNAAKLFEDMSRLNILNPDAVNRTANEFLARNKIGPAVEMMLMSRQMFKEQEILQPMIDILKSKRPKIVFFGLDEDNDFYNYTTERYMTETFSGKADIELPDLIKWCDIAWFEGINEQLARVCSLPKTCKIVVRMTSSDGNCHGSGNVDITRIDNILMTISGPLENDLLQGLKEKGVLKIFTAEPDNEDFCEILKNIENQTS